MKWLLALGVAVQLTGLTSVKLSIILPVSLLTACTCIIRSSYTIFKHTNPFPVASHLHVLEKMQRQRCTSEFYCPLIFFPKWFFHVQRRFPWWAQQADSYGEAWHGQPENLERCAGQLVCKKGTCILRCVPLACSLEYPTSDLPVSPSSHPSGCNSLSIKTSILVCGFEIILSLHGQEIVFGSYHAPWQKCPSMEGALDSQTYRVSICHALAKADTRLWLTHERITNGFALLMGVPCYKGCHS